ncbi:MAG: GWxTD domain-containing protein [Rhodothermaceae bacterium]|nr:GWxTD domain-containing protein [Rhodothermaceae bacterium]
MRRLLPITLWLLVPVVLAQGAEVSPFVAGMAALEADDYAEALAQLQEALADNPQHADAHYALALAYGAESPLRDERQVVRHLDRALRLDPENAQYLEARLEALRRTMPEEKAFSTTDTRRPALARRILEIDSTNALAHEELALSAFLEFDWRRQLAFRSGGWNPLATRGRSGAANRARARADAHLAAALQADPKRVSAHRLRVRLAVYARDEGQLDVAARAFFTAQPEDPAAWLYLGLTAYRRHDLSVAERHFTQALAAMPASERASFEQIALLLSEEEERAFSADSATVAARFWQVRDPRLLSSQNERRLEHYARLALADLLFADVRRGTRGWATTRGEVVVRYGLPDVDRRWVSSSVGAYQQWVYGGEEGFSLVFQDLFLNGDVEFPSSAGGEDEATRARSLFHRTPERFVYAPPGLTPFPHLVATFKGADGQTEVVIPMGVPVDGIESPENQHLLDLRTGAFLLDTDAEVVAEARRQVKRLGSGDAVRLGSTLLWTGGHGLSVDPGSYTLVVEFEQPRAGAFGVAREPLVVPDYHQPGLRLSSAVLAFLIEEENTAAGPGRVRRGPFVLHPSPQNQFATDAPIYLYVEAYGLTLREGRTQYEVEAILKPEDHAGALARVARRLFGRPPPSGVSVRYPLSGTTADEGQYAILDVVAETPGPYLLTLRIHDLHAGRTVETTRRLELTAPHTAPSPPLP